MRIRQLSATHRLPVLPVLLSDIIPHASKRKLGILVVATIVCMTAVQFLVATSSLQGIQELNAGDGGADGTAFTGIGSTVAMRGYN